MKLEEVLHIKISVEDKEKMQNKADKLRLTLSSYCRMKMLQDLD